MKTAERILTKAAIIQFIILMMTQFILHHSDTISRINLLTKYEGVTKMIYSNITDFKK